MLHSKNLGTVQVGAFCSMALTDQHDLYGWGSGLVNFDGSDSRQIKEPTKLNFPASKVKSINLGSKHAAAISEDGGVYTWGEGGSWFSGGGQLGHGQNANEKAPRRISFFDDLYKEDGTRIKQVSCADRHTIFLTDDGDLLSCGLGEYGRLVSILSLYFHLFAFFEFALCVFCLDREMVRTLISPCQQQSPFLLPIQSSLQSLRVQIIL